MKTIKIIDNDTLEVRFKFPFHDKKSFMNMVSKIKCIPKTERNFNSLEKSWEITNNEKNMLKLLEWGFEIIKDEQITDDQLQTIIKNKIRKKADLKDNNLISIRFSYHKKYKNQFDKYITQTIKTIPNIKINGKSGKYWSLPLTKDNVKLLTDMGFNISADLMEMDNTPVNIICRNNNCFVVSSELNISIISKKFTFDDYSECWVGGQYLENRVKYVKLFKNISAEKGTLPIGLKNELVSFIEFKKVKYDITDKRKFIDFNFSDEEIKNCLGYITLRDYQVEAIKTCLDKKNCIIKAVTGSGKTEVFLALCKLMGLKTLIVFDKIKITTQTLQRAINANLDAGIIQGQNVDENHQVVMTTIQSSGKLTGKYDVIICDENHHCSSNEYQKLLKNKYFIYRFGFSATPLTDKKEDTLRNTLTRAYLGDIEYEFNANEAIEKGVIAKPHIKIINIYHPLNIDKVKWVKAEKLGIIENEYRNNIIKKLCDSLDGQILILVKKIKHGKLLENLIDNAIFIHGGKDQSFITDTITIFENGENIPLIASSILDEGVSINNINNIIIAAGGYSNIKTIQKIGRGGRIMEGKETFEAFDFMDNQNETLLKHSEGRIKQYKDEGYHDIEIIDY